MGLAALFKFVVDGLKVIPSVITVPLKAFKTELSAEVYPALLGVGYICGPKIASYMFAGGLIGWFVLIPAIITFGGSTILYPGTKTIADSMLQAWLRNLEQLHPIHRCRCRRCGWYHQFN